MNFSFYDSCSYLLCVMLHSNHTFFSSHIPNFNLFVSTRTSKSVSFFPNKVENSVKSIKKQIWRCIYNQSWDIPKLPIPSKTKNWSSVATFFVMLKQNTANQTNVYIHLFSCCNQIKIKLNLLTPLSFPPSCTQGNTSSFWGIKNNIYYNKSRDWSEKQTYAKIQFNLHTTSRSLISIMGFLYKPTAKKFPANTKQKESNTDSNDIINL